MSKHFQESSIEFRRDDPGGMGFPKARGVVVYQYGGTVEECIAKAREEFNLDFHWKVIEVNTP